MSREAPQSCEPCIRESIHIWGIITIIIRAELRPDA
jgi:hypothetical protein